MTFYKQTTDLDLGETSIENIFLNDFLPMADGTSVKVYLLAFKFSQEVTDKIISNDTLAKHLNIPLSDVYRSWDFWEKKGIIKKIENDQDYDIEFLSLRQLVAKGLYSHTKEVKSQTKDNINRIEASKSPEIRKMFYEIDQVMRRQLVPNERNIVLEWVYTQNINIDIIVAAFKFSVETKNVKHINYVTSVVRGWQDSGLFTMELLEEHFEKTQGNYRSYKSIYRLMGYANKLPSAGDKEIMDIWLNDFKLDMDFLTKVITETSKKTSNINMNYMHKVVETLFKEKITSLEAYEASNEKKETSKEPKSYGKKKSNQFHNFDQRTTKYTNEELEKKLGIRK